MRLTNRKLLRAFGGPGPCEYCLAYARSRHRAHVISRGAGGPDHRLNLASLCPGCHWRQHQGNLFPSCQTLRELIARREGVSVDYVERLVYAIIAAPLGASVEALEEKINERVRA